MSRVHYGHERVVLTEHGTPAAVIISVDELGELERVQDAADLAVCQTIRARSGVGVPHKEFMAMLDAEDAGEE